MKKRTENDTHRSGGRRAAMMENLEGRRLFSTFYNPGSWPIGGVGGPGSGSYGDIGNAGGYNYSPTAGTPQTYEPAGSRWTG